VIDKQKSFYFKVRTIDQFKSYIKDPKSSLTDQAFNERKKNIDIYVLGKYAQVAAGQRVGTDLHDRHRNHHNGYGRSRGIRHDVYLGNGRPRLQSCGPHEVVSRFPPSPTRLTSRSSMILMMRSRHTTAAPSREPRTTSKR